MLSEASWGIVGVAIKQILLDPSLNSASASLMFTPLGVHEAVAAGKLTGSVLGS